MENEKIVIDVVPRDEMKLKSPFSPKLIYVFTVNDEPHRGKVKIGETLFTGHFDNNERGYGNIRDNSTELNENARKRIDQYTKTVGVEYQLLYTTLAIGYKNGEYFSFSDKRVHDVLKRSGKNCVFLTDRAKSQSEWFEISLETAINAINAAKEKRTSLNPKEIVEDTEDTEKIELRKEQKKAVEKAKSHFLTKNGKKFLWNCKMRFGKTISALTLIKEMQYKRAIIITHRPAVKDNWYEDFKKVFTQQDTPYVYASKDRGEKSLNTDKSLVYFASIQDLRGSDEVGGHFDKNTAVFRTNWDLVVIDEAHEGTQTEKGQDVVNALINENTKTLLLSGTPFNLLEWDDYSANEIYTWDYIQEQKAKLDWEQNRPFEPNPYAMLPRMNIRTYDLSKELKALKSEEFFSFSEFFRVDENGKFVYEFDVEQFLDLLCNDRCASGYPFSTNEYRNYFRHTFWVLPGVKEAKALEELLKKHSVFGEGSGYKIINVAGNGSDDVSASRAYEEVKKATESNENYTITLSCGRLTTGVTIPNWTAVFMLYGSVSVSCATYMQTIFRVQSPAKIDGKIKTDCYVFDFAPDRMLKVIAESVKKSHRMDGITDDAKLFGEFLNFCPIISESGSELKKYNVYTLVESLKKVYIEQVVKNGFDDIKLYSSEYLSHIGEKEIEALSKLKNIVGSTSVDKTIKDIELSNNGLTEPEKEEFDILKNKEATKGTKLTPEEEARLKALKEKAKQDKQNREKAIKILRGVSTRIPLMMYGATLKDGESEDTALTVDNFTSLVDDASWNEFMQGVTKEMFDTEIKGAYDKVVFLSASKRIREMARDLDKEGILSRIKQLADIFAPFRNPDKETVLTPWRVVNMHLGDTIGGWNFYDEDYRSPIEDPRFISIPNVTDRIFTNDSRILEIDSKTCLYPLYVTYSIFRERAKTELKDETFESERALWKKVIAENIFVLCRSNMAKKIAYRTLLGFERGDDKANLKYEENLISKVKKGSQIKPLVDRLHNTQTWSAYRKIAKEKKVNFTCVVGNPPYQHDTPENKMSRNVYHNFINFGIATEANFISLISPSKWMAGEKGPYKEMKGFFKEFTSKNHLRILHDYCKPTDLFSNVDVKGGIAYFLYQDDYKGKFEFTVHDKGKKTTANVEVQDDDVTIIRFPLLYGIVEKVKKISKGSTMTSIVSSWNPYGFISDFFVKNNENVRQSETKLKDDDVLIHGLIKNKRYIRYIPNEDAKKNRKGMMMYKVFVPRANGSGALGEKFSTPILGTPILGTPIQICTDTFLEIGPFETEGEAKACLQYIKTKFFRAMVGAKKTGVFNYKDAFCYVPLQDFTEKSDIDWSKTVAEIDKQLYKKYKLSAEDIAFIEANVKPME